MPRQKAQEEDLLQEVGEGTEDGNAEGGGDGGSAAEVAVRGRGRTVADALKKAGLKKDSKDLKGKFNELLRTPTYKIVCQRIFPRQARGQDGKMRDCTDVVDFPPPLTLDEIIQSLREEYGGRKWNVRVVDEDGEVIDARNVDVAGEPKLVSVPTDEFSLPDLDDTHGMGGNGAAEPPEDPQDREIISKEKEQKILALEKQNAELRSKIEAIVGEKRPKTPAVDPEELVRKALAEQEAKHRAELDALRQKQDLADMERRITERSNQQILDMKALVEKMQSGNPMQATALSDLTHKLDLLQQSIDTRIEKALGTYRELTNQQITALEKGVDSKLDAIRTQLSQMASHKPENPIKDMVPLITSSIERSTQGYKEFIGPLLSFVAKKPEEVEHGNSLEDTLETLGKFGMIPGFGAGAKDFGGRVVDFAEKMAPEILNFIREEKRQGREVTEQTIRNHLKLQSEKISREVQAAAQQEIRQIAAQRGLPGQPGQQGGPHRLPAPVQGQTVNAQGVTGQSPVGRMSPEEAARYQQRPQAVPPPAAAPAPAPLPAAPAPVAPPPQPPAASAAQAVEPPEPVEEVEEEGDEEEDGEPLTIEEEMAERVNSVLELLEREMRIRPRNITWPNAAWDDLPGDVLNKIIMANDEEDVYNAIQPHADKELSERIWALIRNDGTCREFVVAGINIIKGWAVELQEKQRRALEAAQGGDEQSPAPAPQG